MLAYWSARALRVRHLSLAALERLLSECVAPL